MLSAEDLLCGPRGRGLCLHVAASLRWEVQVALLADDPHKVSQGLLLELERVDATPVGDCADPLDFVEPLTGSISDAMYWQEPEPHDIAAAESAVIAALRPIAEAIVAAPASRWWDMPIDLSTLRYASLPYDNLPFLPPPLAGAHDALRQWRAREAEDEQRAARRRPRDPAAPYSGNWWSTPAGAALTTTTRPLSSLGSTHLVWEEDDCYAKRAAIWSLAPTRTPRVWEIDRPDSWTQLVEAYPLDVSLARGHDWYMTTGRAGQWAMPDWSAVAAEWDAIHLSVAGYLTTATRSLDLTDSSYATVLAGWDPDETWWLRDLLTLQRPDPELWELVPRHHAGADPVWRRVEP